MLSVAEFKSWCWECLNDAYQIQNTEPATVADVVRVVHTQRGTSPDVDAMFHKAQDRVVRLLDELWDDQCATAREAFANADGLHKGLYGTAEERAVCMMLLTMIRDERENLPPVRIRGREDFTDVARLVVLALGEEGREAVTQTFSSLEDPPMSPFAVEMCAVMARYISAGYHSGASVADVVQFVVGDDPLDSLDWFQAAWEGDVDTPPHLSAPKVWCLALRQLGEVLTAQKFSNTIPATRDSFHDLVQVEAKKVVGGIVG
eukprot:Sspe_Gene.12370::Locus_4218_Transcript_1_1_Confidence_1.000_Length_957::g.12370::m.12370